MVEQHPSTEVMAVVNKEGVVRQCSYQTMAKPFGTIAKVAMAASRRDVGAVSGHGV